MSSTAIQLNDYQFIDAERLLKAFGAVISSPASELISLKQAADIRQVCYMTMYLSGVKFKNFPVLRMSDNRLYMRRSDLEKLPPVKHPKARKFRKQANQADSEQSKPIPAGSDGNAGSEV